MKDLHCFHLKGGGSDRREARCGKCLSPIHRERRIARLPADQLEWYRRKSENRARRLGNLVDGLRFCLTCRIEKLESAFKGGAVRCRSCAAAKRLAKYIQKLSPERRERLERHRQHVREGRKSKNARRADLMRSFKAGKPCLDCGGFFHPTQMDFDHRNPLEKRFNISAPPKVSSIEALQAEIDKCDLVCANCHRMRTFRRWRGFSATPPEPDYLI